MENCCPGLERVAEELMGRRKWKLYQEVLARSQLNVSEQSLSLNERTDQNNRLDLSQQQQQQDPQENETQNSNQKLQQPALVENHSKESEVVTIKSEVSENIEEKGGCAPTEKGSIGERFVEDSIGNSSSSNTKIQIKREGGGGGPSYPVDWNPTEKCYFCVDGKLLTVNERGELVAESGPAPSEAELAQRTSLDSDSDSSDSSPEIEVQNPIASNVSKNVTSLPLPPNMTSLESMAAQIAAVASLQGLQTFYPNLLYQHLAQPVPPATITTSEANIAAISPTVKESLSPSEVTGEQPLDLSAKPSPNSSTSSGSDPKQAFRAKPRMSALAGRRTYTEEELHSALQDIMSGKLGTRRAAVQYGIPRSTLRNKVYKISTEQKRGGIVGYNQSVLDARIDADDDDKELSGDDEKDDKLLAAALAAQPDDLSHFASALQKMSKPSDSSQMDMKPTLPLDTQVKMQATTPQPHTPPVPPNAWFDPQILLQSLLLSGSLGGIPGLISPKPEDAAELFKNLFLQQQELLKEQLKSSASVSSDPLVNNKQSLLDPRLLMPFLQQQHPHLHQQMQQSVSQTQQQPQQHPHPHQTQPSLSHTSHHFRIQKSETPETASSIDMSEMSDDPSVILKIPSYKPVAGSSSSGKNGEGLGSPVPQTTPPIMTRSPQHSNNLPGISPPLAPPGSESQSPPISAAKGTLSLREFITKGICRTFSQQANDPSPTMKTPSSPMEPMDQMKRAQISVIKNLGGTDITRFASTPNILSNNTSSSSQNAMNAASGGGVGGKGTRPKRGKYRNYDRDSLVEAVKAVQRGEMSVHRAGSYYGVPHSTLEYKVKERHLMRPRKREPKPQPLDDRTGCSSSSNTTNSKNTNIPGISAVSSLDKTKTGVVQKPAMKNPPFPSTSPNGMKVPIFDPNMAAQLQYTSQLFWQHPSAFGGIPLDFGRSPGPNAAVATGFPPNTESFLASQMMQRFHEDSNRLSGNNSMNTTNIPTTPTSVTTNSSKSILSNNTNTPPVKSARELAESLYDGPSSNGSFLDGIIRQTLDRKPSDLPHAALLDQLVKNTRTPTLNINDDHMSATASSSLSTPVSVKTKRPSSPLPFTAIDIKRERSSPSTSSCDQGERSTPIDRDISRESVESLLKMRDGLTLKVEGSQHQQQPMHQQHNSHLTHPQHHSQLSGASLRQLSMEELNGSSMNSLHDKLGQIKSEPEDI